MEDSSDFHPGFTRNTVQLLRRTTRPLHSGSLALALSAMSATAARHAARLPKSGEETSSQENSFTATMILTSTQLEGCCTWPLGSCYLPSGRYVSTLLRPFRLRLLPPHVRPQHHTGLWDLRHFVWLLRYLSPARAGFNCHRTSVSDAQYDTLYVSKIQQH